jgi:hypothetical protein
MAALDMPRRALWPELAVFANNPWKGVGAERRCATRENGSSRTRALRRSRPPD